MPIHHRYGLFLALTIVLSCANKKEALLISELEPKVSVEPIGKELQKYKYYLAENFEFGNKHHFEELKAYAQRHLDKDYSKYALYAVVFYKESSKTNRNYKETPSDLIVWHGEDIVYTFEWRDGKYSYYMMYKDGKIVNDKKAANTGLVK